LSDFKKRGHALSILKFSVVHGYALSGGKSDDGCPGFQLKNGNFQAKATENARCFLYWLIGYVKMKINGNGNEWRRKEGFENSDTSTVLASGDVVFREISCGKSA
jgi:hypothetical protein